MGSGADQRLQNAKQAASGAKAVLAAAEAVAQVEKLKERLILDESGNNLDAPNLRKITTVLKQVADKYGLTVVLACQDVYTHLVTPHSAGMIQLVRASSTHVLNAAPVILQEDDDPALIRSLEPYLRMGRPAT
jgi:ABC-type branched-subunit amino acid transport system ATPase component